MTAAGVITVAGVGIVAGTWLYNNIHARMMASKSSNRFGEKQAKRRESTPHRKGTSQQTKNKHQKGVARKNTPEKKRTSGRYTGNNR